MKWFNDTQELKLRSTETETGENSCETLECHRFIWYEMVQFYKINQLGQNMKKNMKMCSVELPQNLYRYKS